MSGPEHQNERIYSADQQNELAISRSLVREQFEEERSGLDESKGYISNSSGLNFRQTPSEDSVKIGRLPKGTTFIVDYRDGPWGHIIVENGEFKGQEGWVYIDNYTNTLNELELQIPASLEEQTDLPSEYKELVHIMIEQQTNTASIELIAKARFTAKREELSDSKTLVVKTNIHKIYSGPEYKEEIRVNIPKGTKVDIAEKSNGGDGATWYKIETEKGSEGWIPEKKVEPNLIEERYKRLMKLTDSLRLKGWHGELPVAILINSVNSKEAKELGIKQKQMYLLDANGITEFVVATGRNGIGSGVYQTPGGDIIVKGTEFRYVKDFGAIMGPQHEKKEYEKRGITHVDSLISGKKALMTTMKFGMYGLDESNASTVGRGINIHGTNRENSLGFQYSDGCIRMANMDASYLAFILNGKSLYLHIAERI